MSSNSCREKQICTPRNDIRCPSRLHPCPPSTFLCCNRLVIWPYDCKARHPHRQLIIQWPCVCWWHCFLRQGRHRCHRLFVKLSNSSSVFGLHTSSPKTKLQSVGSDSGPDLLNVVVDGNPVDLLESFTYQTSDRYCRSEITRRIGLASSAMSSLNNIPIKDDTVAENWAKN